jgi:hypothetical protein
MNCLHRRKLQRLILAMAAFLLIIMVMIPATSIAGDVDVHAEGAYTDNDLVLHIYADINAEPILSFGVKVDYPPELTYASATKNEAVWFFGDGTTTHPYMDPEDDGSGVAIIGGKLDTADPTAGVTGSGVLLGTVTFTHSGVIDFSGVNLTYARGDGTGDYKNFVATDGTVYDGPDVEFTVTVLQRGDANADGVLTFADMSAVRTMMTNNEYSIAADCNNDGVLTFADMSCIRSNM